MSQWRGRKDPMFAGDACLNIEKQLLLKGKITKNLCSNSFFFGGFCKRSITVIHVFCSGKLFMTKILITV